MNNQPTSVGHLTVQPDEELAGPAFDLPLASRHQYLQAVHRGYSLMKSRRVVIAGLARDLEEILPLTIRRIEALGHLFSEYRVIVYENDSTDRSLELLQAWARSNPRVTICSEIRNDPVNLAERCLSRATRMAYYRSQCQRQIADYHSNFDNVVLVDMDLIGGWSHDGVANTFGHSNWDFVGAFGIIFRRQLLAPNCITHYDAWAYRTDEAYTPMSTKEVNSILFRRGDPLQAITSCFGGLGIYRMPAYLAGCYDGTDVEHVTFHRKMRDRGYQRTYLNPSQITIYGRKHRTLDHVAARMLRAVDTLPGRTPVEWSYPKADESNDYRKRAA
ncbi:MAG: hypothetical protein GY768_11535 [Planctomycetaceae bacterium]|nr:hypothetical protein [Planctomycetaceae bacterium]